MNISIKNDTDKLPEYHIQYNGFETTIEEAYKDGVMKNFPNLHYTVQL